jgi:NAD(P)-dependent dehydrogenase (short-subunit alcohol dehydrogenase family)
MVDRRTPNVVFPSLSDRVAIITGAGQGLGCGFAKGFAAVGAIAIIAERNGERGEAVAAEIAAAGGKARAITTDVADPASLENMIAVMTRSMARELGRDGITVNAILPGAISTEIQRKTVTPEQKQRIVAMQCIPRPEVPEDLVGTVLFLASDASAFLTGQALTVDGGATHT